MLRKLTIEEMGRMSPDSFHHATKRPLSVVLDNIRSMHNVGAIFRTADALRLNSIFLCGITGKPPHAEIHKSALGAEEVVEWSYYKNTYEAVEILKNKGYSVWALEQTENSVFLHNIKNYIFQNKQPIALVLGNEVEGVQQSVLDICDGAIEIEQFGTKHSLNVSVAGGISLWYLSQIINII